MAVHLFIFQTCVCNAFFNQIVCMLVELARWSVTREKDFTFLLVYYSLFYDEWSLQVYFSCVFCLLLLFFYTCFERLAYLFSSICNIPHVWVMRLWPRKKVQHEKQMHETENTMVGLLVILLFFFFCHSWELCSDVERCYIVHFDASVREGEFQQHCALLAVFVNNGT